MSKNKIKDKFSKAAMQYEDYALLQKEIADSLFDRILLPEDRFTLLDIGVGTGYLLSKFKDVGFIEGIYGIDIAEGMLSEIRNKNIKASLVQSDALHLPFAENQFDLVVSNVAYQWVRDLNLAFLEAKRVLKDKGMFYFTIFTYNTLKELRESLTKHNIVKESNSLEYLPKSEFVWKTLEDSGFTISKIDVKEIKQYYNNVGELLGWLKNIGANKYWPNSFYKGLASRSFLSNISKYYEDNFKEHDNVYTTFEVMFVEVAK